MKNQTLELPCPARSLWPPIRKNWHHQLCTGDASSYGTHRCELGMLVLAPHSPCRGRGMGQGVHCAPHQPYDYGKTAVSCLVHAPRLQALVASRTSRAEGRAELRRGMQCKITGRDALKARDRLFLFVDRLKACCAVEGVVLQVWGCPG